MTVDDDVQNVSYFLSIFYQLTMLNFTLKCIINLLDRLNSMEDFKHLLNNQHSQVVKALNGFTNKLQDISSCCFITVTEKLH